MPTKIRPKRIIIRTYQVGFGDCYLLSFQYPKEERHVLIDFGSTGKPEATTKDFLVRIAENIKERCNSKLHAVVATHRHKDHISGFSTSRGKGSGDIIASCNPVVVVQPWTEDPKAKRNATAPATGFDNKKAFVASLSSMNAFSTHLVQELKRPQRELGETVRRQLSFLGEDNIANRSAIDNLIRMGKKHSYIYFKSKSGLEKVLPGVKIHVLGPPTLKQSETIKVQRSKDEAEFWHLLQVSEKSIAEKSTRLFPNAPVYSAFPHQTKWLIRRMQHLRGDQLLQIVRILDTVMNNTSLILLFETGKRKLLFSGDAQIENWSYALSQEWVQTLLKDVSLYKVGHHGSLNATPKSLWKFFQKRSRKPSARRLQTLVSTMTGKHGNPDRGTEVPRKTLVEALKRETSFFTTQDLKGKEFWRDFVIKI